MSAFCVPIACIYDKRIELAWKLTPLGGHKSLNVFTSEGFSESDEKLLK